MAQKRGEAAPKAAEKEEGKPVEAAEAPKEEKAPEAPKEEAKDKAAKEVEVKYRDHKGEPTSRVFSLALHGKDYLKLAEEFKETNKSKIIA